MDRLIHENLESLGGARQQIADLDEINYPLQAGWLVSTAEERQILRVSRGAANEPHRPTVRYPRLHQPPLRSASWLA
ncbi:hypothetical protein [Pseudomonas sp. Marseille-Q0931]|uniref:hypothetical protein n=1 Tax=Pseudomonas sp. Marseille-Q0931 TaxID=2697507 RepID=UPI0023BA0FDD|nr:hypothetical protein [Pseudomonas sp. Marseille-Q0931]